MAGRSAGCGWCSNSTVVLVGAFAASGLCASVLGAAEDGDAVAAAKVADSCETGGADSSLPLTGWVVLQWTLVMALARCVSVRQARALERAGPSLSIYPSMPRAMCLSDPPASPCSGLGAVPFFLIPPEHLKGELVGAANAVAAGVTLAASFGAY